MTEFQKIMATILGEDADTRVSSLFMKIDVDTIGKVNWVSENISPLYRSSKVDS